MRLRLVQVVQQVLRAWVEPVEPVEPVLQAVMLRATPQRQLALQVPLAMRAVTAETAPMVVTLAQVVV